MDAVFPLAAEKKKYPALDTEYFLFMHWVYMAWEAAMLLQNYVMLSIGMFPLIGLVRKMPRCVSGN